MVYSQARATSLAESSPWALADIFAPVVVECADDDLTRVSWDDEAIEAPLRGALTRVVAAVRGAP